MEGQGWHFGCLAILLVLTLGFVSREGVLAGSLFGVSSAVWFGLLIADTIAHQVFVWLCWRLELGQQKLTGWFGSTERAFGAYAAIFATLFAARFVLITLLAIANRGTLEINPLVSWFLTIVIAVPAIYLFYSVRMYFTFRRAFGIDHFDPKARAWPLVRQGIFKYTANGMYVFGIGALWVPAFALQSTAALVAAAFSHAYIWVHYFTVEKPDMRRIYGSQSGA